MIVDLMLYAVAMSALIGFAGLAVEDAAARASFPRRGIWVATLALSISLPIVMVTESPPASAAARVEWVAWPTVPAETSLPQGRVGSSPPVTTESRKQIGSPFQRTLPSLEQTLRSIWLATTAGMFALYAISWMRLSRSLRKCPREIIDGHEVWITTDLGPAVMGCFAPRVLLPRWALEVPVAARELILAHELEHIAKRDACILLAGLLVVAVAPWNLFLWWQLRRLRLAIEVDCDARILARRNADVRCYGEVLLLVSQKALASRSGFTLTEATSDLERRILLMTRPRDQRRWAALAASVMLSFGCLAVAVELNAPTISRTTVLRKLPPEYNSPYLQAAEAAARTAFPDLFQGRFSGSVEIQVGLDRDGAVLGVDERQGPLLSARFLGRLAWGTRVLTNPVGWAAAHGYESQDAVAGPTKLLAWFGPQNANKLYLSFDVIKWPYNPARSAELVRDAVAARYPGTLRVSEQVDGVLPSRAVAGLPQPTSNSRKGAELMQTISLASVDPLFEGGRKLKLITVFMNDNGTINRSDLREIPVGENQPSRSPAVFVQMGIDSTQLAHRGFIWHRRSRAAEQEVMVDYAWPRRANDWPDEADSFLIERVYGPQRSDAMASQGEAIDRAIMARYFPDLWEGRSSQEREPKLLWVLMDRRGDIQSTGRVEHLALAQPPYLLGDLERLYPGIRTGEWVRSRVKMSSSQSAWIMYIWLAADSPISDLSSFDIAKRPNVVVDLRVSRDGSGSSWGSGLAARFGEPAVHEVPCFFRIEVTATDGEGDAVNLRTRIQPITAATSPRQCQQGGSVTSDWSPESSVVRVLYGQSGSVDVEDGIRERWHISLSPRRP